MTWAWLDLVDGVLRSWPKSDARPTTRALRVDARLAAGGGPATWASWCRFDGDESLAFDDAAVTGALRRRLAAPWPVGVSTLLVDWSRIAGAVTLGTSRADVIDDPFAAVFPRTMLELPAGALGENPAPTGPVVTRYGSGNPWPWDVYAGQVG